MNFSAWRIFLNDDFYCNAVQQSYRKKASEKCVYPKTSKSLFWFPRLLSEIFWESSKKLPCTQAPRHRGTQAPCSYSSVLEEVNLNFFLAGLQVKQSLLIYLIDKLTNRRPIHWNILFSKPYRRQWLTYILMW